MNADVYFWMGHCGMNVQILYFCHRLHCLFVQQSRVTEKETRFNWMVTSWIDDVVRETSDQWASRSLLCQWRYHSLPLQTWTNILISAPVTILFNQTSNVIKLKYFSSNITWFFFMVSIIYLLADFLLPTIWSISL